MKYPSFVEETTTTSGTGNLTLAGATTGHRALSAAVTAGHMANNDYVPYYLYESASLWERGIGQWTGSVFVRSVILENNAGTTSAITLTGGGATLRVSSQPILQMDERWCWVYNNATESVSDASSETISFGAEDTDTDGSWSAGDPTKIHVPGWCDRAQFQGNLFFQATASFTGNLFMRLTITGMGTPSYVTGHAVPYGTAGGTQRFDLDVSTPILHRTSGTANATMTIYNDLGAQLDIGAYYLNFIGRWLG